jgi:1-acyl-sn-glycerol-3-phosphate acyltransferase
MKYICKFLMRIMGWKVIGGIVPTPKGIVLGVPHTSLWDFVISWIYYTSVGGKAHILVKKKFFFWPAGYLLSCMGAIPVDNARGASLVKQIISEFNKREVLHLAIAPEGTRKPTGKWKAGFHTIARAANVPVYYGLFDWGHKRIGFAERIELTDDVNADMIRIKQWYKDSGIVGKHPGKFMLGDGLD